MICSLVFFRKSQQVATEERVALLGLAILLSTFLSSSVRAAKIQIIYRPSHGVEAVRLKRIENPFLETLLREFSEGPDQFGHVALGLPEGSFEVGRIVGWEPSLSQLGPDHPVSRGSYSIDEWLNEPDRFGTFPDAPGEIVNNESWAARGENALIGRTMSMSFEVPEVVLRILVARLRDFNQTPIRRFQLIGNPTNNYRHDPNRYNCVGAMKEILRGTGIDLRFFSERNFLTEFLNEASHFATPWDKCAFYIAKS